MMSSTNVVLLVLRNILINSLKVTPTLHDGDKSKDGEETDSLVTIPDILPTDYETDNKFKDMFRYKLTEELSENDKVNR